MTVYIVKEGSVIHSAWQQEEDADQECDLLGGRVKGFEVDEAFAWASRAEYEQEVGDSIS